MLEEFQTFRLIFVIKLYLIWILTVGNGVETNTSRAPIGILCGVEWRKEIFKKFTDSEKKNGRNFVVLFLLCLKPILVNNVTPR